MSDRDVQLYYDSDWHSIDAYDAEGWSVRVGPSINSGLQASRMEATLANQDLTVDPSNVESPLYGKIGRYTPARFLIDPTAALFTGEAASWAPEASLGHNPANGRGRAITTFAAEGQLRRLAKWKDPVTSPMTRQISSYGSDLVGFWPLEDESDAQTLRNVVPTGQPGAFSGNVTLGGDSGPQGAARAAVLGSDGRISGQCISATYNGYQISFTAKLDAVPGSGTYIAMFQWYDSQGRIWYWRVNDIAFEIAWYLSDGTLGDSVTVGTAVDVTQWVRYRCRVTIPVVGTLQFEPAWQEQDGQVYGTTETTAGAGGQTGTVLRWESVANTYTDGAAFGHVMVTSDAVIELLNDYDAAQAFAGYNGESAGARFLRVLGEAGFTRSVVGTSSLSAAMGPQPVTTLAGILEEIQRTEQGFIYDSPISNSITFRLHNYVINRDPVLALTYGTNVAAPLKKIIDDLDPANDLTVKNADGSEVRLEDSTSVNSTQPPPDGAGRVTGTLDVNLRWASGLSQVGGWVLANNVLDKPRFQSVTVDLLANPELLPTVVDIRPGDLITISDLLPDTVTLIVVNYTRSGNNIRDSITFECLPGDLYVTGEYDDAGTLYDSGSTTLNEALDTTETGVDIFSADLLDVWTSAAVGADIITGGERMTITAVSAGSASGTGWAQTLTVTRSANGVVKSHSSGQEVHVFQPALYTYQSVTL